MPATSLIAADVARWLRNVNDVLVLQPRWEGGRWRKGGVRFLGGLVARWLRNVNDVLVLQPRWKWA